MSRRRNPYKYEMSQSLRTAARERQENPLEKYIFELLNQPELAETKHDVAGTFVKAVRAYKAAQEKGNTVDKTIAFEELLATGTCKTLMRSELKASINYGIPEICLTEEDCRDYAENIKVAIQLGIIKAVERFDVDATELMATESPTRAFLSFATYYIRYERCHGNFSALQKLKERYPSCTEYYGRLLIVAHKNGIEDIRTAPAELIAKYMPNGSIKIANKLKLVFSDEEHYDSCEDSTSVSIFDSELELSAAAKNMVVDVENIVADSQLYERITRITEELPEKYKKVFQIKATATTRQEYNNILAKEGIPKDKAKRLLHQARIILERNLRQENLYDDAFALC